MPDATARGQRHDEELVAESVALCVCGFLGLDTGADTAEGAFERIAALVDRRLEHAVAPASVSVGDNATATASAG